MFKGSDNNRQKSWQIISVTFSGEASLDYQVYRKGAGTCTTQSNVENPQIELNMECFIIFYEVLAF